MVVQIRPGLPNKQQHRSNRMSTGKYRASINNEGKHCVDGRGNGLGFYAGWLNPNLNCRDVEEAERATRIANIAYKAGYEKAQWDIREAMGIVK
jgi:hypothetical protein